MKRREINGGEKETGNKRKKNQWKVGKGISGQDRTGKLNVRERRERSGKEEKGKVLQKLGTDGGEKPANHLLVDEATNPHIHTNLSPGKI